VGNTPTTPTTYSVNKNSGAHTFQLNAAIDPDSTLFSTPQSLSYVIVSAPALGSVSGASAVPATGNGTITYTTPTGQPSSQPDQTTSFTYKVCDNGSPQNCSSNKTITVNIINNVPTDISLSTSSINENNSAYALVGVLTTTDFDGGPHTYSVVGGTDQASFNIPASTNVLQLVPSADFETKSSYAVRIRTTDASGLYFEKDFTITINNVNEAPTNITLSATSISENNAANAEVGTLTTTDSEGGTHTYSIVGGADQASFNIPTSTNSLQLIPVTDYETKNSYAVVIRTTDSTGQTFDKSFIISINDQNEAPTGLALSSTSINENNAANAVIGMLTATDPDANSTFTFSIPAGSSHFNINGNQLRATNVFNYEAGNSYPVTIRVTDGGSLTVEQTFNITINNVNEAPTAIALSSSSINENNAPNTVIGTLTTTDTDLANTFTYTITAGASDFNINGNQLRATNSFNFEAAASYSVTVQSQDSGGETVSQTFTISVNNGNEAPTLAVGPSTGTLNEDSTLSITLGAGTDVDAGDTLVYHFVTLPQHGAFGALPATSASPLNGTVTYTPQANYNGTDQFTYRVCDQQNLCSSALNTVTLTISALNDTPVITASTATTTLIQVSESGPAATITLADGTDADGGTLDKIVVTAPAQGSLSGSPTPTAGSVLTTPLTYTPALGHTGIFEFVYKICDAANACTVNPKVFIEVLGRTPLFNGSATTSIINIAENASATTISLNGATDPDAALLSQTLSYTVELEKNLGTTSNLSTVPATGTGSVDYTPTADTAGVEILKYKVCDNAGTPNCTPYKYITINIGTPAHPILMTAGDSSKTTTTGSNVNFVLGRFVDLADSSANLVYVYDTTSTATPVTSPTGTPKSLAIGDRTVTYTPLSAAGTETFKYKVCRADGAGNPDLTKCSPDYSVVLVTQ
jgi:hypothetical protein